MRGNVGFCFLQDLVFIEPTLPRIGTDLIATAAQVDCNPKIFLLSCRFQATAFD